MEASSFAPRLRITPDRPGVYLMKDPQNRVIYVGKASSLKKRLRSYFGSSASHEAKIQRMMSRLADFEFIVTDSPSEALILENTLIKKHRPIFNARLKDDKTYPYIKIDRAEDFPQVYITRKVQKDGAIYFGPFASAGSIRKTLDLLKKLFPYRSCTKVITAKDPRPCLEYYINRCSAPCIGAISQDEYHRIIDRVIMFMDGKTEPVLVELKRKMLEASDKLDFERAGALRDQVRAIEQVTKERSIKTASVSGHDLDAIAMAALNDQACVDIFMVRHGKLTGRENFVMDGTQGESPERVLTEFVKQFYQSASFVPRRILLQHPLEEREGIESWLREKRGGAVTFVFPQKGVNRQLIQMAEENALHHLSQLRVQWWSNPNAAQEAMAELQKELNLPAQPYRIECYDISNIQGNNPVGSMITFEDGAAKPADYRRFKIRNVIGVDDYAMMQEVLRRRFKKLAADIPKRDGEEDVDDRAKEKAGQAWGNAPDLILIDGGKGHLSSALEVLLELGLDSLPLASIAKENEWIYVPQTPEPIVLSKSSQALRLVQRVRDEAHRFAITYHRKLRNKANLTSAVDMVSGIGPTRRKMLMRHFGSLKSIKNATIEEIAALPGITHSLAARLKQVL